MLLDGSLVNTLLLSVDFFLNKPKDFVWLDLSLFLWDF